VVVESWRTVCCLLCSLTSIRIRTPSDRRTRGQLSLFQIKKEKAYGLRSSGLLSSRYAIYSPPPPTLHRDGSRKHVAILTILAIGY
jgi:hypothetical protein